MTPQPAASPQPTVRPATLKTNGNAERLYSRLGFRRHGELGDEYVMTTG
ncbi:hypothetical protein [Actinopolymorpha singaporensis]|uniref:Acetyltransferase (GNAT) family protein n=1 Tax=Actinopolymorpha singaporensis TaxID=117157 RepID=A0A1H1MKF8_9ACTN|nr:hypothetical protein [Actinopolymorpha singaporensis]SDR87216.1 hypothetical protein SAMN04489717_0863 [Actinopolymorpha singaporensis]